MGSAQREVPVETKASVFRGYVRAVDELGIKPQVEARVSAATRAMMEALPPVTAWLPSDPTDDLLQAVADLRGQSAVRHVAREASMASLAPIMRSMIEGLLRLFELSPATLLARLPQLTASTARGVDWQWEASSRTSGVITVSYPARRDIPRCVYEAIAGSLEALLVLGDVQGGTVSEGVPVEDRPGNAARFTVSW